VNGYCVWMDGCVGAWVDYFKVYSIESSVGYVGIGNCT
jgi:hypothetical protein